MALAFPHYKKLFDSSLIMAISEFKQATTNHLPERCRVPEFQCFGRGFCPVGHED
jgi:hypothetical protein